MGYFNNSNSTPVTESGCWDSLKAFLYKYRVLFGIACIISAFLIVILIPLSFQYVEKGEVALRMTRIGDDVDTKGPEYNMNLTQNGRYFIAGATHTLKPFDNLIQQDAHNLDSVASNSRGLIISVVAFYKIKQNELGQLFDKFTDTWQIHGVNEVISSLKGVAPNFTVDDYVTNIEEIRSAMEAKMTTELALSHLEVVPHGLIILKITFKSDDVDDQFLTAVIELENNKRALIQREVDLIRQDTEISKQEIISNQSFVTLTGKAEAKSIVTIAQATANTIQGIANTQGFTVLFDHFNVTETSVKEAYLELYAMENNIDNLHLLVNVASVLINVNA
jgi:hypothetical protein